MKAVFILLFLAITLDSAALKAESPAPSGNEKQEGDDSSLEGFDEVDEPARPEKKFKKTIAPSLPKKISKITENLFIYFAMGSGSTTYSGSTKSNVEQLSGVSTVKRLTVDSHFGLYFPWPRLNTSVGFAVNTTYDHLSDATGGLTMIQLLYGPSFWYFFSNQVGYSWFVRSDVGGAFAQSSANYTGLSEAGKYSRSGFGILGAFGYGFAFHDGGTNLILQLSYVSRFVASEKFSSTNFGIGILF